MANTLSFLLGGGGSYCFLFLVCFTSFIMLSVLFVFFVEGHFFLKNFTKEKGKRKLKHGDKLL
jgi:uncharacterized membrane protein